MRDNRKTKDGVTCDMYAHHRGHSKTRGHKEPEYNLQELRYWCYEQDIFHALFDDWVKSGYDKWHKPSIDRIDPNKHYFFENMQLMTFRENNKKGAYEHKFNEFNTKKPVVRIDKDGIEVKFDSISEAEHCLEVKRGKSKISLVCNGKRKTHLGYKWRWL